MDSIIPSMELYPRYTPINDSNAPSKGKDLLINVDTCNPDDNAGNSKDPATPKHNNEDIPLNAAKNGCLRIRSEIVWALEEKSTCVTPAAKVSLPSAAMPKES